ncbi:hypothetical protein SDJN03_14658, partial [Cucurbita argyrosperma subsp. sororia]
MGGNNQSKKSHSSFSIFNFFKFRKGRKEDHYDHGGYWNKMPRSGKVWPSDEDKTHRWVAEPGIDRKAKDYIDKIYRNRIFESERQTVTLPANGTKLDL